MEDSTIVISTMVLHLFISHIFIEALPQLDTVLCSKDIAMNRKNLFFLYNLIDRQSANIQICNISSDCDKCYEEK